MAFNLQAISGSTTISLYDGSPFFLLSAKGLGGAVSRRVAIRGPMQNGETDNGYRLRLREIELIVGFKATTDALLDASRDSLRGIFRPLSATPVILKLTRDDGGVRQLDCYLVNDLDIRLDPTLRPGHYHQATIKLYAPDPRYYNPTPGTVTVTGSAGTAANWYLAGGAIGTASVLMSGGTPTQGQVWSYAGTIAHATSWTLAIRSTQEAAGAATKYAFVVNNVAALEGDVALGVRSDGLYIPTTDGETGNLGSTFMTTGTANYIIRHDTSGLAFDIGGPTVLQDAFNRTDPGFAPTATHPISGTARRWRSDATNTAASRWSGTILLYALYSPGLTYSQTQSLDTYMAGGVGGTVGTYLSVPYGGDLIEYPVVSLRGPIIGAVLRNVITGKYLYFAGTIAAGTTYVIDTRPGLQGVTSGTVSKLSDLSADSQLAEFYLTPDSGNNGYNPLLLTGTNTSGSTQLTVVYYNRYMSM